MPYQSVQITLFFLRGFRLLKARDEFTVSRGVSAIRRHHDDGRLDIRIDARRGGLDETGVQLDRLVLDLRIIAQDPQDLQKIAP